MSRPALGQLATLFGSLSLISVGGANVLFPEMRRAVVERHGWLDLATFGHLFALSQAAPGPNVMFASAIGWQLRGLAGLLVATVAILLPPGVLALVAGRATRRWADRRALAVATAALVPLALGLMIASGVIAAASTRAGVLGYAISAGAAALVMFTGRNPLWAIAAGTLLYLAATSW